MISEKSTFVAEKNEQVVFEVLQDATNPKSRQPSNCSSKVQVESVQMLNRPGKVKRFGRTMGRRSDSRRAYVSLKPGQEINFGGEA